MTSKPEVILVPHLDDVACAHGANQAWFHLSAAAAITCGSVMVPGPWFPQIVQRADESWDLGIHLTLTSESAAVRWRPLSTSDPASGLLDPHGYLWPTTLELRRHGDRDAVDVELRAQIDRALAAGIDVTHLDHHMGAALSPEFVDITVRIARDYALPMLFPRRIEEYMDDVDLDAEDFATLHRALTTAAEAGVAVGDTFVMPLIHHGKPNHRELLEATISELDPGVNYLSLHCAPPGDIEAAHPNDADWRLGEYAVFADPDFQAWLAAQPITLTGVRPFRDRLRAR